MDAKFNQPSNLNHTFAVANRVLSYLIDNNDTPVMKAIDYEVKDQASSVESS
jgi:hypothetical protein